MKGMKQKPKIGVDYIPVRDFKGYTSIISLNPKFYKKLLKK